MKVTSKKKRELLPITTGNHMNEWERTRLQQAKERKRKMEEHRNYKICIEDWTETREFSTLFEALHEAEREAKERKLNANISISIKLFKSKVSFR